MEILSDFLIYFHSSQPRDVALRCCGTKFMWQLSKFINRDFEIDILHENIINILNSSKVSVLHTLDLWHPGNVALRDVTPRRSGTYDV